MKTTTEIGSLKAIFWSLLSDSHLLLSCHNLHPVFYKVEFQKLQTCMVLIKLYVYFDFGFFFSMIYTIQMIIYIDIFTVDQIKLFILGAQTSLNSASWKTELEISRLFKKQLMSLHLSANSAKFAVQNLNIMYAGDQPQSRYPTVIAPYNSSVTAGTGVWWAQMPSLRWTDCRLHLLYTPKVSEKPQNLLRSFFNHLTCDPAFLASSFLMVSKWQ